MATSLGRPGTKVAFLVLLTTMLLSLEALLSLDISLAKLFRFEPPPND